jgi:YD repeat-containing protein
MTLIHGYDPAGNHTSLDDSKGGLTSYTYDARNELVTITQSGSGVTAKRPSRIKFQFCVEPYQFSSCACRGLIV